MLSRFLILLFLYVHQAGLPLEVPDLKHKVVPRADYIHTLFQDKTVRKDCQIIAVDKLKAQNLGSLFN